MLRIFGRPARGVGNASLPGGTSGTESWEGLDKQHWESDVGRMAATLRTVAIVEDDSELRDSIRTFVEESGWKLTGVHFQCRESLARP